MHLKYRRPWAKPKPKNDQGRWVWALRPRRTADGTKWMCWLWHGRNHGSNPTWKI